MKKMIRRILKEEFQQINQPTGHSCGPTCLKMVHDFYVGDVHQIEDICRECGTDWTVGTPPDRMLKGLEYMGIDYEHHKDIDNPYEYLQSVFEKGHVAILRTMTHGAPHYIVARGYENGVYTINDPWLGPLEYTEEQLEGVWHSITGEKHESFEIKGGSGGGDMTEQPKKKAVGNINIERFTSEEQIMEALRMAVPIFEKQMAPQQLVNFLAGASEFRISARAVDDNGTLLGFYFLSEGTMEHHLYEWCEKDVKCDEVEDLSYLYKKEIHVDVNDYIGKKGLEGIALGVDPKFKGMGVGKKLIEHTQNLGYDYIWGMQMESLGNLSHWLKRRKLAVELPGMFITVQDLWR